MKALGTAVLLLGCWLAQPLRAQVSPGPLARAHRELEGPLQCTRCHAGGNARMDTRCLSCHRDIAWLADRGRGVHGSSAVKGVKCASCHPDHAGADFALVQWPTPDGKPERFDHRRAGWPLEQSHALAKVQCSDCHRAANRRSAAAALSAGGHSNWTGLETSCVSCHADTHRGALGSRCTSCHDAGKWREPPGFRHDSTSYPLTGRHAAVACKQCHESARLALERDAAGAVIPLYKPLPHASCANCHADPHQGRLGAECGNCHSTSGFARVTLKGFDHARTPFPLRGRHLEIPCASCHRNFATALERRPASATCAACHAPDPHAGTATLSGKPVDCGACHTERGFSPATFTVQQHQTSPYPLEGKHLAVPCAACHTGSGPGTARVQLRPAYGECAACHSDPHGGRPREPCSLCHDTRGFRPASVGAEQHSRFGFELRGAHRAVACGGCHRQLAQTRRFDADSTCAACHGLVHGTQFETRKDAGRCDGCHNEMAFVPASGFDHDRDASFALGKGHRGVACLACHRARETVGGVSRVVYRPLSGKCESCHLKKPGAPDR